MWYVRARGMDTGCTYTYRVRAPEDASEMDVCIGAGRAHGLLVRSEESDVNEYTGPMVAEWVPDAVAECST